MVTSNVEPLAMKSYYDRYFPSKLFGRWLSYGTLGATGDDDFKNLMPLREWSFTSYVNGEEMYQRYKSFESPEELRQHLVKLCPAKIDIGAICNHKPKDHRKVRNFEFEEREFVIDIDMTDYDDVRTCCSDAKVCELCWKFMSIAMEICHRALTEDFGFKHVMWVFSGRRGVHCWVSDERARKMTNEQRSAVAEYMSIQADGLTIPLHPSVQSAMGTIDSYFDEIVLEDQKLFSSEDTYCKFCSSVQDEQLQEKLKALWTSHRPGKDSPEDLWERFQETIEKEKKLNKGAKKYKVENTVKAMHWTKIHHLYPRLDVNVSTHRNHLLKAPFCVHPKTGLICTPILPEEFRTFSPEKGLNVNDVLAAANSDDSGESGEIRRFKQAERVLERFVKGLEADIRKSRVAAAASGGDALREAGAGEGDVPEW